MYCLKGYVQYLCIHHLGPLKYLLENGIAWGTLLLSLSLSLSKIKTERPKSSSAIANRTLSFIEWIINATIVRKLTCIKLYWRFWIYYEEDATVIGHCPKVVQKYFYCLTMVIITWLNNEVVIYNNFHYKVLHGYCLLRGGSFVLGPHLSKLDDTCMINSFSIWFKWEQKTI